MVLKGQASPDLLSTYEAERRPVGRLAAEQSLVGPAASLLTKGSDEKLLPVEKRISYFSLIGGYRYRSKAILSEDASPSLPGKEDAETELLQKPEALTGQPGTRVPHLWLERGGHRISTLDLLDGGFVLLVGSAGAPWQKAAYAVETSLGIALSVYRVGAEGVLIDLEHGWQTKMGISDEAAVLVRPDGFVAWRSRAVTADPSSSLVQVLSQVLCRPNPAA